MSGMNIKKWLIGFGALSFTFALLSVFYFDQQLALWLKAIEINRFYRIYRTLTDAGEAVYYFSFAVLFGAASWLSIRFIPGLSERTRSKLVKLKSFCLFLLASMLASGIGLHLLKFIFGRQRPHATEDFQAHIFQPFSTHWHHHSMPSGHSQTLLTVATVLWITFPKSGWVAFPLAFLLALTRLPMQAHFLSDVILGSYLGFAVTLILARKMRRLPES